MRRAFLTFLLSLTLSLVPLHAVGEPDGSHATGVCPPFTREPAPPGWLRPTSHAAASVDTRHYLYEVYGALADDDPQDTQWIVRYVMLPEGNEAFRELEQIFLFDSNPNHKPKLLKPSEILIDPQDAIWKKIKFKLVDRRDLIRP